MALLVFPSKGFFFLLCMARKDRTVDYPVLCTVLYLLTPNPPAGSCFIYPMAEKKNRSVVMALQRSQQASQAYAGSHPPPPVRRRR